MNDSSESPEPQPLRNRRENEAAVNSAPRPHCRCIDVPFDRRNWPELHLHRERQDTNCSGWNKLLDLIDVAAKDGRETFSPSREMAPAEWSQIVTLPGSIAKLTSVKHFILYGSSLVRIPPEIGEMKSLEQFTPYTSYRLHWFPYEITRCTKLVDSTVSTRALYGNYKNRAPFPQLPQRLRESCPQECSVCRRAFGKDDPIQAWISLPVGTDVLPLLAHLCSTTCLDNLPTAPEGYYPEAHFGGTALDQPRGTKTASNILHLLNNGGYQSCAGPLPREKSLAMALRDAAENDHLQLVRELLSENRDSFACVDALIAACEAHQFRIVEHLLAHGTEINGRGSFSDKTPLMASAGAGFVDGVQLLLRSGADRTLRDDEGLDAAGWAKIGGAEHNFFDGMPDDARAAFAAIIQMLTPQAGPAA